MILALGAWQMDISEPLIQVALLVLLATLIWTSICIYRRLFTRSRMRWAFVQLLNLSACTCLALLLAPPTSPGVADRGGVLLTEGFRSGSAPSTSEVFLAPGIEATAGSNAQVLLDIAQLPLRSPALGRLEVLGHGLSTVQWAQLPSSYVVSFEPPPWSGFSQVMWSQQIQLGEALEVSGRVQPQKPQDISRLVLVDPTGAQVDEVQFAGAGHFKMTATPRAPGQFMYRLQLVLADGRTLDEPVPVTVAVARPPAVAIVQSAPSFETRQLKNWAADNDAEVVVFTRISKNHFISQAVNLQDQEPPGLTPQFLARQDLVIMDGRALAEMPASQRQMLNQAVANGLGLFVLADLALQERLDASAVGLLEGFRLAPIEQPESDVLPLWPGGSGGETLPGPLLAISAQWGSALSYDESGRALGLYRETGLGRVGVSVLRDRHRWMTAGETQHYTSYWAMIMRTLARSPRQARLLPPTAGHLATVSQRESVCVMPKETAMSAEVTAVNGTSSQLHLAENALGARRSCAFFWPAAEGWSLVRLLDGTGLVVDQQSRYTFTQGDWLSLRQYQRAVASMARTNQSRAIDEALQEQMTRTPSGAFWPWLLFLLSAGALWLERKLDFND